MPTDTVFYQDPQVSVTSARFQVEGTMYPIRNISAVSATEDHLHTPANRVGAYLVILLALGSLGLAANSSTPERPVLIITLPLALLAAFLWRRAKPWSRSTYTVSINTSGVQKQAFVTPDRAQRDQIVEALHRAVAGG